MSDDLNARMMQIRLNMLRNQMQATPNNNSTVPIQQQTAFPPINNAWGVQQPTNNQQQYGTSQSAPSLYPNYGSGYSNNPPPINNNYPNNNYGGTYSMNSMNSANPMSNHNTMGGGFGGTPYPNFGQMGSNNTMLHHRPHGGTSNNRSSLRGNRVKREREKRERERQQQQQQSQMMAMMQAATQAAESRKEKEKERKQLEHQQRQDDHMKMLLKVVAAGQPGQLHLDGYFNEGSNTNRSVQSNRSKGTSRVRGVPQDHIGRGMGVEASKKLMAKTPKQPMAQVQQPIYHPPGHPLHRPGLHGHHPGPGPHGPGYPGQHLGPGHHPGPHGPGQPPGQPNSSTESKESKKVHENDIDPATGKKSKHALDNETKKEAEVQTTNINEEKFSEMSLKELVELKDEELDLTKTLNFNTGKSKTQDEVKKAQAKKRAKALEAALKDQKGRSSAIPMWRHRLKGNLKPEKHLVLSGKPLFRAIMGAITAAFYMRRLRDARDEKNRIGAEPDTSKVLLALSEITNSFFSRAMRIPVTSVMRAKDLTMDVKPHVYHYGPLGLLTRTEKTPLDTRMLRVKVRVEGIMERITSQDSVKNGLNLGMITYLTTLMGETVWWPAHFLFGSESDELIISPPCTVHLHQAMLKHGGKEEEKFRSMSHRLVMGLLVHRTLISLLIKPETMGFGKPKNQLVKKNIAIIGSIIYEILKRTKEGEFPKAKLKHMGELDDIRSHYLTLKALQMRLPHQHIPHIHEPHVAWKKNRHKKNEKNRKKMVKGKDSDDSDTDSSDEEEDDKKKEKKKKKKKEEEKKDKKDKDKVNKKDSKKEDKKAKGKKGKDKKGKKNIQRKDSEASEAEEKEEAKKKKANEPLKITGEKATEVASGSFKVKVKQLTGTAKKDSKKKTVPKKEEKKGKQVYSTRYVQLTQDCIYIYSDKEFSVLYGEYYLRNISKIEAMVKKEVKNYEYFFLHHKTDEENTAKDSSVAEHTHNSEIHIDFGDRYHKDDWLQKIKLWKRREHPIYNQVHMTYSDVDMASHLFPFKRFKKGMGVLSDPWLDEQAEKLNKWIEHVVNAVITRMSPDGASKQDEAAESRKEDTPRL